MDKTGEFYKTKTGTEIQVLRILTSGVKEKNGSAEGWGWEERAADNIQELQKS